MGRIVYISYPIDMVDKEKAYKDINEICKKVLEIFPEYIPISPINVFSYLENDDDKFHSKFIKHLIEQCHEIWFFGDWIHSKHCLAEKSYADDIRNSTFENFSLEANKNNKMYQFRNWLDLNLYNEENNSMTNFEKINK